ncbi:winged helix DNA-binding domain-containing protein [Calocera cornea HHB12733]|uniref:Winged helix DNA-binding domain-containing protein n=1 Tax=Calocera cornea HHB12733 TaxID=1353952 RepID=A0A165G9V3_9BASI|nr:winged helix DNA-binding domain-containing protein [Calocera cornea HHB12733]
MPPSLQTGNQSYGRATTASSNASSLDYSNASGVSPMSAAPHSASSTGSFPPTPSMSPFGYQQGSMGVSLNGHSQHSSSLYTPPSSAGGYNSYKSLPSGYGRAPTTSSMGGDDTGVNLRRPETQSRYPLTPSHIGIPPIATLPSDEHSGANSSPASTDFSASPRFGEPVETKPVINAQEEQAGDCTAFISKLYHLLSRPEYGRFLRWNEAGDAFILMNSAEFAQFVLPRFFRHSNVSSFVRQINLYGFQRVSTICILEFADINSGDPTQGTDAVQASGFTHPYFRRGRRDLLKNLKPRSARRSKKAAAAAGTSGQNGQGAKKENDAVPLSEAKGRGRGRASNVPPTPTNMSATPLSAGGMNGMSVSNQS